MDFKNFWIEKKIGVWLVLLLFIGSLFVWSQVVLAKETGKLSVKVYDIGQGDSIFIQTPGGYHILVDGGPDDKVLDYLNQDLGLGDRTIDLLISTHPDADHLKGLIDTIRNFNVKTLLETTKGTNTLTYKLWNDTIAVKHLAKTDIHAGNSITLSDSVTLSFVWPTPEAEKLPATNETGIVFKLSYGNFDMLFTADTDIQVQPYSGNIGHVEVLKVPHHGSKTGLSQAFLDQIKPEIAVVSVGKNNRYGHPAANTLEMLQKEGSKVFRTDQSGTVEIVSDGEKWYTQTER